MVGRRRIPHNNSVQRLLLETDELVARLVAENRALRSENARLAKEVERLSAGWDQIRRLARIAPRQPRR